MMMILQTIAACSRYSVQLVIGQVAEFATGGQERVVELIVGIVHLIDVEDGFQAAFIEGLVVGHKGQASYQRLYLRPNLRKYWGFICVLPAKPMNL